MSETASLTFTDSEMDGYQIGAVHYCDTVGVVCMQKKTICCDVFVLCCVFSSVAISLNIHCVSCNYKTSLKFIPINATLSQMTLIFYSAVSRSLVICYKFTSESAGERILTRSALLRPVYSDTTQLNSTDPVEQRTAVFLIMTSWPTNWVNWVTTFIDRWQLLTLWTRRQLDVELSWVVSL